MCKFVCLQKFVLKLDLDDDKVEQESLKNNLNTLRYKNINYCFNLIVSSYQEYVFKNESSIHWFVIAITFLTGSWRARYLEALAGIFGYKPQTQWSSY